MNIFIYILSFLTICFTLIPLIKHEYWVFRVFDYPRLQKLVLTTICFVLQLRYLNYSNIFDWILLVAIALNGIHLMSQIILFTPFAKKQVLSTKVDFAEQTLSLMVANVYEGNKNTIGCLKEIADADPDVVLLLETNQRWDRETRNLSSQYPYHVRVPLENTYGMLLYSKLPLLDANINYLVEKDIPSIHCTVTLKSGLNVQLYALHPTPPVPNENPRSTERDKELLLVADMAKQADKPVIVIGDLNDVAWSYTTELFLKMSGLLDPRRGRGFFNTFHAHYPFMRFPLDHAFFSPDFKLKELKRLPNFDSDHFPIFIKIQYEARATKQQEPLIPNAEDVQEAIEKKQEPTEI